MSITSDTRQEAFETASTSDHRQAVLGVILSSREPLGASQVAERLGWPVTSTRPRLTELLHSGQIYAAGKRQLPSGRKEATFTEIKKTSFDNDGQGFLHLSPSV